MISCEHAYARLPRGWTWPAEDRHVVESHWAYDIGAAELCHDLAQASGAPAVLAGFSRLLIDPNRPLDSATLFRGETDGVPLQLNASIDGDERARRVAYWEAYHDEVDRVLALSPARVLLAVHTFTPEYEGQKREVQLGVLFDKEQSLAEVMAQQLAGELDIEVRLNEPYSGKRGLIYSADLHAERNARRALEIEVRQDLAVDVAFRARLVDALAQLPWP